jgi:phytoene dehydrogenase-like protein
MILATSGHAYGWPFVRGGSQNLANALASYLRTLGGEIVTNARVIFVTDIPPARVVLFDLTPRQILAINGLELPNSYRKRLQRFRYGPGVFKIDWALNEAIPWGSDACRRAGTVHVGGGLAEIAVSERDAWNGVLTERPFVLLAQPSLFDSTRAPAGKHTAWAYCHVPHGSTVDRTTAIESQIERYAPGFKDCILARHTMNSRELEAYNSNNVGGDILGGVNDLWQLFFRPVASLDPYHVPSSNYYICSSSTPPGPGVHGLCGYFAAQSALRRHITDFHSSSLKRD